MDPDNGDLRAAEDSELHDDQDAEDESRREALRQVPLKDSNQEIARKKGRVANSGQNRLKPGTHLPIEVGGTSQANGEVSKERLAVVRPQRYGTLGTLPTKGKDNGFRQRSGFSRLEFDELDDEQGGDREPLIKQTTLKTNRSSAAHQNIVRSPLLQYAYIAIIMGLAGVVGFGILLDGTDLLLGYLWPNLPYSLRVALITLSVCFGHSLGFHGAEHLQASCKIPFRKFGVLPCELLVVTASGCLTWAGMLGVTQAIYEPGVGLEELFYTTAGEFLGGVAWALSLDLYQQSYSVELTSSKVFSGWGRDHFVIDFLTKLPSSFLVIWLLDLYFAGLDLSKSVDRFSYNFFYTSCLFINYLVVASYFRGIVFSRRKMVPVPVPSTLTDVASSA